MSVEIGNLAKKCRRALRNEQGTRFTADEFQQLAELGLLEMLQTAEAEELRARWRGKNEHIPSAASGSRSGKNPASGRSNGTTKKDELRAIEALVANG